MASKLDTDYALVTTVARPTEAEGLKKERAILLLWYLRNAHGIDDVEAYDFICDGDDDNGVDGLWLEEAREGQSFATLHIFQSKYPTSAKNVGETEVRSLIGAVVPFESEAGLKALLAGTVEEELRVLIERFDLVSRLASGKLQIESTLVTAGALSPQARSLIQAENHKRGRRAMHGVDVHDLAPLVRAFASPDTVRASTTLSVGADSRFEAKLETGRVVVCSVLASEIASLPGIADRTLFDLNVRRDLGGGTRVRAALDSAIGKAADHANFLAFHNGLTVICEKVDTSDPATIKVTDFSVVNGAQSTLAFHANKESLSPKLRIVVKFVEISSTSQAAREVAVRSNTQNAVNARNLRARDGIQLRLEQEIATSYPGTTFELRPDALLKPKGVVIHNDEAAQLLCAIVEQRPWLAVKKLSLFEAENYPSIFRKSTSAAQVVLVHHIASRVDALKAKFPEAYTRSWKLTRLIAAYLVGQLLRENKDHARLLDDAEKTFAMPERDKVIDKAVKFAAAAMTARRNSKSKTNEIDDFKVDFKREDALRSLALAATETYLVHQIVDD